jgi:hypothetical protein
MPGATQDLQEPDTEPKVEGQTKVEAAPTLVPWHVFLKSAKNPEIRTRLAADISGILKDKGMDKYCVLALLEPEDSIDSTDLDRIFTGLSQLNHDRSKDVMLLLLARGGSIEPAYQISKLCKSFASSRFIALV